MNIGFPLKRESSEVETHAVSVHEAISRERSGHPENKFLWKIL
ncbi:MAG: hypothetical protein ACYCSW_11055 [bacterium]